MGWFDEQIKQREISDREIMEDAFMEVANAVMGVRIASTGKHNVKNTMFAIDDILKYFRFKSIELKEGIESLDDALEYALRPHGIMRRNVKLEKGWYHNAFGPMLGFLKENDMPVALLPKSIRGYYYTNPKTGKKVTVNRRSASELSDEAICFYRPLPLKELKMVDLIVYLLRCISFEDIVMVAAATTIMAIIGLVMPGVTKALTGPVLNGNNTSLLLSMAVFTVMITVSTQLFDAAYSVINTRITTKTALAVESAVMARLLSLPANFFRRFSSGELYSRANSINSLCNMFLGFGFSLGLTSISSLLYFKQLFDFAPELWIPALIVVISTVVITVITSFVQIRISKQQMLVSAGNSGLMYALISGIQKIKLAGAERRAYSKWLSLYAKESRYLYNPPAILKLSRVILLAISLIGNIVLYYLGVKFKVGQSNYMAFNMSFGLVMGGFSSLCNLGLSFARIRPILEMAEPILKEKPEVAENREIITGVRGKIELNNVSFKYDENGENIIDNLSININPGDYIAIVGKTGCGKSTLVRLLLGFEKPQKGAIYYDDRNIETIDLKSLRKHIGTVIQSGSLFQGDIFSNIAIASNSLTLDEAWEAAEIAGIADDIRAMPMGMNTCITEGQGGVSGGQKQRIMIARAIASKPKILIMDEATSALDNITQKQISESLDKLNMTRIVIAHRLSTIRNCNRILVLENGKIIEEGNYEELLSKKGFFYELVERQRIEEESVAE